MGYLYGDSTPFPLDENFIETLRDITATCVTLLQMDEEIEKHRREIEEMTSTAEARHRHIDAVGASVNRSLDPHKAADAPFRKELALRVEQACTSVLDSGRRELEVGKTKDLLDLRRTLSRQQDQIPRVLEGALLDHELVGTQWGLSWSASADLGAEATAIAMTPFGLEATFELKIDASHPWAQLVKVSDLRAETVLQLPRIGGIFSKETRMREERLDRYFVTEVTISPQRATIVLRRSQRQPSPGFEIVMYDQGQSSPSVRSLDDQSRPGEPTVPTGIDAAALEDLWSTIANALRPLINKRVRLVDAQLDDVPVVEVEQPARIARVLIKAVAGLVTELRRRSPVAGEVALKRDVDDGRREELFISVAELMAPVKQLSGARRALFDEFGLATTRRSDLFDIPEKDEEVAKQAEDVGLPGPSKPAASAVDADNAGASESFIQITTADLEVDTAEVGPPRLGSDRSQD